MRTLHPEGELPAKSVQSNHGAFHARLYSVEADALTNGHRRALTLMGW